VELLTTLIETKPYMHINASNFKEHIKEDMLELETLREDTFKTF
jgi:hypothetical protein